jgi:hypothetical protein
MTWMLISQYVGSIVLKIFLCCTILKLLFLTNNILIIVSKDQFCLLYLINRYIEYFPCILRSHLNSWIANCVVWGKIVYMYVDMQSHGFLVIVRTKYSQTVPVVASIKQSPVYKALLFSSFHRKFHINWSSLKGYLSDKTTFSLSQRWPLNTSSTVYLIKSHIFAEF